VDGAAGERQAQANVGRGRRRAVVEDEDEV
jgi:hypothetical protein